MADLPLNEPAGALVKTTCVDFPGILAGSFFLKGCNLRCPYCYNTGLVLNTDADNSLNTIEELFFHLEKRQGILKGLVISGGEPLLNPYTPLIIQKAKSLGYKIKLDTNGTLPDKLEEIIKSPELKPDFIAMDIKTSPSRYAAELCPDFSKHKNDAIYFENLLLKSIELVSSYNRDCREFRTVLVPELIRKEDIIKIAELLPSDASWRFAQFRNENCLNPMYNNITPYTDKEINEFIEIARSYIKDSELR